jgi:ABC-type transport system substrate-binding protein
MSKSNRDGARIGGALAGRERRFDRHWLVLALISLALSGCQGRTEVVFIEREPVGFERDLRADASDAPPQAIAGFIFNALTKVEGVEGADVAAPDLAESFESSADQTTHQFSLREGVRFHNDQILTSLDVKYSFETFFAEDASGEPSPRKIGGLRAIEIPDARTVVFRCALPCPKLPVEIAAIGIIPEGTNRHQATNPIGTGPFRFPGQRIRGELILVAHRQYFRGRSGQPGLDKLIVRFGRTAP